MLLPLLPTSTDWKTADGNWQMNTVEPLGAVTKRVSYTLDAATAYRIGIMKNINGTLTRFLSDPLRGDQIGTPIQGKIELQENIPLSLRDYEYWLFTEQ